MAKEVPMQKLSSEVEEVLLAISASGFDWVATIARSEILAADKADFVRVEEMLDKSDNEAVQLLIVQTVLDRFR
jgi:ABC-type dipeptide/oligopeptide/nickel transport system permease subunit